MDGTNTIGRHWDDSFAQTAAKGREAVQVRGRMSWNGAFIDGGKDGADRRRSKNEG